MSISKLWHSLGVFQGSVVVSIFVVGLVAGITRDLNLVGITLLLAVLEIGLSFDNAVVNAGVLKEMSELWQERFLKWGILIAVFGMRLIIPVVIVAVFGHLAPWNALSMAFTDGHHYGEILHGAHAEISAFGGMFLLMVFLNFILEKQDVMWLSVLERPLRKLGRLKSFAIVVGAAVALVAPLAVPADHRYSTLMAAVGGLVTYLTVDMFADRMETDEDKRVLNGVVKSGMATFVYLEVLDASFSFDGVIGAFALSSNVMIIMAGLGVGALFVRSLTIFLVREGHLDELPHLEHAAHYAIGVLAACMFTSLAFEVPEFVTGLTGAILIILGYYTSVRYNRKHPTSVDETATPEATDKAVTIA